MDLARDIIIENETDEFLWFSASSLLTQKQKHDQLLITKLLNRINTL